MDTVVKKKKMRERDESDPWKKLWSASDIGAFRTPFFLDLGWEVISHKKGGGKREIKVQICYSYSLKRHHFLESRSCVSWNFPATEGSFSAALGNCLTVLAFVTRGSGRAVLCLCTRVQASSRLWVLHSRTLCASPTNGDIDFSRQVPAPRDAPAHIETSQMLLPFIILRLHASPTFLSLYSFLQIVPVL